MLSGIGKGIALGLLVLCFLFTSFGLVSCSRDRVDATSLGNITPSPRINIGKLAEVSPPPLIQDLKKILDRYQPQVEILSPKAGETLDSTAVTVQLKVRDFPAFQDPDLKLGPHLHLILDNEPYIAVYDPSKPYVFTDLAPGTHTIRVFASRPWHESFKNDGAFAQTTFNILTQTGDNSPDPNLPLLTYSRPKGEMGAEPIMIDYYLTNAPLHLVAQAGEEGAIADWRIRITVNGESFIVDSWQPIYLKGFVEGDNWVQLEFIDAQGDRVDNAFNNTVRVVTYHRAGQDTLSKITRGEVTLADVRRIVDPEAPIPVIPTPIESPAVLEPPSQPEPTAESNVLEPVTEDPIPELIDPIPESPTVFPPNDLSVPIDPSAREPEIFKPISSQPVPSVEIQPQASGSDGFLDVIDEFLDVEGAQQ